VRRNGNLLNLKLVSLRRVLAVVTGLEKSVDPLQKKEAGHANPVLLPLGDS
jgi:hypothetical protein